MCFSAEFDAVVADRKKRERDDKEKEEKKESTGRGDVFILITPPAFLCFMVCVKCVKKRDFRRREEKEGEIMKGI